MSTEIAVRLEEVTKRYGPVTALAIAGGPQLLFLDEPTAGMDVQAAGRSGGACAG